MKIAILADGNALPRPSGASKLAYEATYPYLLDHYLRQSFRESPPRVAEYAAHGRSMESVIADWYEQVELKRTDVAIVHLGWNDCVPGFFSAREQRVLSTPPLSLIGKPLLKLERRYRSVITRWRHRKAEPVEYFRYKVEELAYRTANSDLMKLIFLTILPPPPTVSLADEIRNNVALCNRVLEDQTRMPKIDVLDLKALAERHGGIGKLTTGGMLLNALGHKCVARELQSLITPMLSEKRSHASF